MIVVYDVQTFYGTHAKTFQHERNAINYRSELLLQFECVDPIHKRYLSTEEFCYEDIED